MDQNIQNNTASAPTQSAQSPQSAVPATERVPENREQTAKDFFMHLWRGILSYFNVRPDIETQPEVEASIRGSVSFKGSQLLNLIFAIFIASLGLNMNSTPVVIGAMLISPLMGPIIGAGLGIAIEDSILVRRSLKNIAAAVIGSLAASALYFLIIPQYDNTAQLLARTSPSVYDVFVALFGGAAGILSIAAKNKGQVLPGVAIATSLIPPLCTAGYGLATWQMRFFFGALYLFFTNMIFIFFATWIGVKLLGFKKVVYNNERRARRVKFVAYTVICATVAVSIYLTVVMLRTNIFMEKANDFVNNEMIFPNTQVLSHKEYMNDGKRYIDVTLIGDALPKDSLQLAMMNKLDSAGLGGTVLNIHQGFALNRTDMDASQDNDKFYQLSMAEIASRQSTIDSLRQVIAAHNSFSDESVEITPELKVLFPTIRDIAMTRMVVASTHNPSTDTLNMVFVNAPEGLGPAERIKLKEYIEARFKRKDLHLALNPPGFPWGSSVASR